MSAKCEQLHALTNRLKRHYYPFDENDMPKNGVLLLFEKDETAHSSDRIVRIGINEKQDNLRSWIKKHFKHGGTKCDFRRKIRCAIVNQGIQKGLYDWSQDDLYDCGISTSGEAKKRLVAKGKWKEIDRQVSDYICQNISFVHIEIKDAKNRRELKPRLISTVANCTECHASKDWLGKFSTKDKVCESGLWLENHLCGTGLTDVDMDMLERIIMEKHDTAWHSNKRHSCTIRRR